MPNKVGDLPESQWVTVWRGGPLLPERHRPELVSADPRRTNPNKLHPMRAAQSTIDRIKTLRDRGMRVVDIAEACGVAQSTVSRYIRGERR